MDLKVRQLKAAVWIAAAVAGVVAVTAAAGLQPRWSAFRDTAPAPAHPVDIGFAQSMNLHHAQAIGMAQLMLDGRPSPLAGLARSIAYSQLVELGEMRGWLRLWGQPLLPPQRRMDWMLLGRTPPDADLQQYLLDCQRAPSGMPGLASTADLARLRQLEGRARDEHFLKLMLAHHQGGIPMARFAASQAQLPVVRQLAAQIVLDQSKEIDRIQRTLAVMAATAADGIDP